MKRLALRVRYYQPDILNLKNLETLGGKTFRELIHAFCTNLSFLTRFTQKAFNALDLKSLGQLVGRSETESFIMHMLCIWLRRSVDLN